jgi:hypothetical protein
MIDLIATQKPKIESICKKLQIRRLEVFGSAANGQFDPSRSDLDFIVAFDRSAMAGGILERYLALASQLEALLGHKIDLLTPNSIRNPYFSAKVNQAREVVYEAGTGQASP